MRIKLKYLVQSGGPNFISSVRGPVRLVRYEKYTQPGKDNKLLIRNYQIPSYAKDIYNDAIIVINLLQESYKVELEVYNATFTALNTTSRLFKVMQTANKFGNFIHFNQCFVEVYF